MEQSIEKTIESRLLDPRDTPRTVEAILKGMVEYTDRKGVQMGHGAIQSLVNQAVFKINQLRKKRQDRRSHNLHGGEVHAILKNKEGALAVARFAGPGSDLYNNLEDLLVEHGSISKALAPKNFVSPTDKLALWHDIRYALSKTPAEVRQADDIFTKELARYRRLGESQFNTRPSDLVGVKVGLERAGILRKGSFASGEVADISDEQRKLLQDVAEQIERDQINAEDRDVEAQIRQQFGTGAHHYLNRPLRPVQKGGRRPLLEDPQLSRIDLAFNELQTQIQRWNQIKAGFPETMTDSQRLRTWAFENRFSRARELLHEIHTPEGFERDMPELESIVAQLRNMLAQVS